MTEAAKTEQSDKKIYAGKFETVEQLEEGYKNSAKVFQENEELKKKWDEANKIPDAYMTPEGSTLDESTLNELKELAKNTGLNQEAFTRLTKSHEHKRQKEEENYVSARKSISDEQYTILENYVKQTYAEPLVEGTLKKLVLDKDARLAALQHRDKLLNSSVSGMQKISTGGYRVSKDDVLSAAEAVNKAKSGKAREEAKAKHIQIAKQFAVQKQMAK